MAISPWWLTLIPGDRVYVAREKRSESGMATVYMNGKKWIHVHLAGTPLRIDKSTGCVDEYPRFQICRDEKDHMDAVWQRCKMRETLDNFNALTLNYEFRVTEADNERLREAYRAMIGESK